MLTVNSSRIGIRAALLSLVGIALVGGATLLANSVFAASTAVTSGACTAYVDSPSNTTISQSGNECIVKFKASTASSNSAESTTTAFTPAPGVTNIRVLLVGGGAGGDRGLCGYYWGRGGGGGGVFDSATYSSSFPKFSSSNEYSISVGRGGVGGGNCDSPGSLGSAGGNTAISGTFTSNNDAWTNAVAEGGRPATSNAIAPTYAGRVGGNSGRERKNSTTDLTAAKSGGSGSGGIYGCDVGGNYCSAGSGGGAGGAGIGLTGGPGRGSNIVSGTTVYYGMGGAGAQDNSPGAVYSATSNTVSAAPTSCLGADETGAGGSDCAKAGGGASTAIGGEGGSGLAVLRYSLPTLSVNTSANGAISGQAVLRQPVVQLNDNNGAALTGQSISVTASAGAGCEVTNNTATTSSATGLATFSNLTITGNLGVSCTLNYVATGFVSVSQAAIGIKKTPEAIGITSSSTDSTGLFINGTFYTGSTGTVNLNSSDVASQLLVNDLVLEASGAITISANVASSTSYALTLKAGADINQGAVSVSTTAGALTYWSDTNASGGGGIQTARGSSIQTNGGDLTLTGGLVSTTGYAKGTSASSYRGVNLQGAISTGVGNVIIRGEDAATESPTGGNWGAGVLVNDDSSITTSSGNVTITGLTNTDNTASSHYHSGVMIGFSYFGGTNQAAYDDAFLTTDTGNISINGTAATISAAHRYGVLFFKSSVTSTSGSISLAARTARSDAIDFSFGSASTGNTISTSGAVTITGDTSGATSAFNASTISAGGALTLNVAKPTFANMNLNGAGSKTIQHPTAGTNFGAAVDITGISFASTSASLTVGRSGITPTQAVTLGNASTSIAGNINVYGAAITQSGAVATTSGGNVTYSGAGAYSQTGALTSAGSITQSGGTSVSVTGATQAVGAISYSGSGAISNSSVGTISSTGGSVQITSTGSYVDLAKNVTAAEAISISANTFYGGAGAISAGTTLTINAGTTSGPAGNLTSVGNMVLSSAGRTTLNSITVSVTGAGTMNINSGTKTLTDGGLYVTSANITTTTGALNITGNASGSWGFYFLSNSKVQTTTGAITITGDTPSTIWGGHLGAVNVLSDSGAIIVDTKSSYGASVGYNATTNFGAISPATSSSTVQIIGNTYGEVTYANSVNYRTSGSVVIESTASAFTLAPTIRANVFTGNASVRIGTATNTSSVTVAGSANIVGDYVVYGNAIAQNAPVTTSAGNITIDAGGAVSTTGALNAGGGLYITGATTLSSTAAWATNTALDVTASGNLSTGSLAPITVNSGYLTLNSTGGTTTIAAATTVPGNITLSGTTVTTSGTLESTTGLVSITASSAGVSIGAALEAATSISISPATTYAGAGALTAGTDLSISGGTTVAPGANLTAGGNLTIAGTGRVTIQSITASTTTGAIAITGGSLASTDGGLYLNAGNVTSTTGSIALTGNALTSWGFDLTGSSKVQSTTGAITIVGNTPAGVWGGYLESVSVLSTSGAIVIEGGGYGIVPGHNGANNFGAIASTTSSSDVTIRGDRYWASNSWVYFKTTGAVVIEPKATLFAEDITINYHDFNGHSSLRIGKSTNARGMNINGTTSIVGDYEVFGNAITQNAPVTSSAGSISLNGTSVNVTAALVANGNGGISATASNGSVTINGTTTVNTSTSGKIQLKATTNVIVEANKPMNTNGGAVVLWSRSSSTENTASQSGEGFIRVDYASSITTKGGAIILAGSSSTDANGLPNGHAYSNTNAQYAIWLSNNVGGTAVNLNSSNGNLAGGQIRVYGQSGPSSSQALAAIFNGSTPAMTWNSGKGRQDLNLLSASSNDNALEVWGSFVMTSAADNSVATPAIKVDIRQTSSNSTPEPIQQQGYAHKFIASNGGGIDFSATTANTTRKALDAAKSFSFLAPSGSIRTNFGTGLDLAAATNSLPLVFGADGTDVATSSASVTILGGTFVDNANVGSVKVKTSGSVSVEPSADSFTESQSFDGTWSLTGNSGGYVGGITFGKAGNTATIATNSSVASAGDIAIYAGTANINSDLTAGTSSSALIQANSISINAANTISASAGIVTLTPLTATKPIGLGSADSSSLLGLTDAELDRITAGTLRIGDGTNSGNITVNAAISIDPLKVGATAIRTTGTVSGSGTIQATNLGISASSIDLGTTSAVGGNLALAVGAAPTFSSSLAYTPTAVDGIAADFGTPTQIVLSQTPTNQPQDAFMAVAFNPPPTATLNDKFNTALQTQNSFSTSDITASKASGPGTLAGVLVRPATAGAATFSGLNFNTATGDHTITFSALSGTLTETTGTYRVQAGEPSSLLVSMGQTSLAAGKTFDAGTRPTVTLKDASGNTIAAGPNATATVTAIFTGTNGAIVAGATKAAVAGVATFDTLALSGKVENSYTIKYSVSFNPVANPSTTTTVESSSTAVTMTPGDATQIALTQATGAANRIAFVGQPSVAIKDAYGNTVTSSTASVTVSEASTAIALGGTVTKPAQSGVVTFDDLSLTGTAADGYTLTYTATSPAVSTTQPIDLTHGTATQLVKTSSASSVRAGQDIADTVIEIRDADNNLVDTGNGSTATLAATVTRDAGGTAATLVDGGVVAPQVALTRTASAGIATFNGLRLEGVQGAHTLNFKINSPAGLNTIETNQAMTLNPGVATNLRMVEEPTSIVANVAFSPAVKVEFVDSWNNRVTQDANSATPILVDASDSSLAISGQSKTAVSASSGLVTFTGLTFTKTGNFKLKFTSGALPALVSANSFSVTHGEAHHLAWVSSQPSAGRSAIAFSTQPQFEVQDQWNNPVTSGSSTTVTATVTSANSGDVLSIAGDTATTGTGSAQVTFSGFALRATAANYAVRYTATNANKAIDGTYLSTASVAITYGLAHHITATPTSLSARSGIDFTSQPVVKVRDSAENVVEESTLTVTASLLTGGVQTDQTLGGSITRTASNGEADFGANVSKLSIAGSSANGLTLRFTVSTLLAQTLTTDVSVNLTPGAAVALQTKLSPSTVKRRENMTAPQVELIDAAGNVVTGDSASEVAYTVYKVSDNSIAVAESVGIQASSGVVTVSGLNLTLAPSSYYLKYRLTSNSALLTSANFVLNPGSVAKVAITTQPSSVDGLLNRTMAGELLKVQPAVQLLDVDDYPVSTQNSGQVSVAISTGVGGSLNGSTTATVTGGQAAFSGVKLIGRPASATQTAENYTLKFSFNGFDSVNSSAMYVTHNVAHHLTAVRAPDVGRAGIQLTGTDRPQVEIRDQYDNLVISGAQATADLQVTASVQTGTGTATIGGVTVQSASSGVATFDISLGGLSTNTYQLSYSFIDGGVTGASSSGVTITDGLADRLSIATPPATVDVNSARNKTGQALYVQPVIELFDAWGNLTEGATGYIDATIAGAQFDARDRLTDASMAINQGSATFTNLALIGRPGHDYALTFTWRNRGVSGTSATNLRVTHADADHLTIATQPNSQTSVAGPRNRTGDALTVQPVVEVRDFDDNIVTSLVSGSFISANVTTGGGSTNATDGGVANSNTAEILDGVATFSALKVVATPNVDQKLTFTSPTILVNQAALTTAESSAFSLTTAVAAKLAVVQQPCTGVVINGTCSNGPTAAVMGTQPIAQVQDRFGNPVSDYVGSVTASVSGSDVFLTNTGDVSGQPLTVAVANGLATFNGLELRGTPGTSYQINFASNGLTAVSSANLVVTHGTATQLLMVRQPIGAQTGSALGTQPQVRIADVFGNTVTSDSATVITASASGGLLFKTPTAALEAQVSNGIATFDGLKFTGTPGANYTLGFASGVLATATSGSFAVTHANVSQLIWDVQPTVGQSGENLTTQPKLILKDFDNNVVTSDNTTVVTATISTGSNGSLLNETATAVAGIVQFANLKLIGDPGATYKLTFTASVGQSSFSAGESNALVPLHARPDALTMRTPSMVSGGLTGTALTNQPKLYVRDRFGNIATTDNSTVVTASIGVGAGGTVSGTTTATAVNGLVDFAGLVVSGTPGVGYQLNFSAVTGDSRSFSVLDTTSFTLDKVATATLSYVNQNFVPVGVTGNLVSASFATDSTATPVFATQTADTICVVDSTTGQISIRGVGTCVVTMTVPAATFYRTNSVTANLVISKAYQSAVEITSDDNLDFWSTNYTPTAAQIGDPNLAAGYVFASTGSLVYSVDGDCKFIGGKVIPGNAGSSCTLFAFKRGDANYRNSDVAELELTTNKIAQQALRIGNDLSASVGDVTLFTSGGSGEGAVSYTVDDAGTAQCSLISGANGSTLLRAAANGSCDIFAQKAASTNFNIATSAIRTFNFTKQEQVVSFTSTIPMNPVALASYLPTASASSTLPVNMAVTTGNGTTCQFDSIVPTKLNFITSGVCVITATQAGNSQYVAASATQRITIGALNQTITFAEISSKKYGDPDFKLAATSNSGLAVSYRLGVNVSPQACSVSSTGLVSVSGAGSCEIVASQPGNQTYLAAPPVTRVFDVLPDQAGKPRIVSISAGNQWFNASFVAPSYLGGTSVQSYRLQITDTVTGDRYANSACSATPSVGSTNLTCTVVGIPNGASYTAQVAAITRAGLGLYSSVVGPLTAGAQVQGVTNLTTTISGSNMQVAFEAPIATDSSVTGYRVSVAPAGTTNFGTPVMTQTLTATVPLPTTTSQSQNQASSVRGASLRFGLASLTQTPSASPSPGVTTAYEVKVETVTSAPIEIDPNNYLTKGVYLGIAVPEAARAPITTLVDGATAGTQAIFLAWARPTADGGSAITGYNVKVNGANLCMATTLLTCEQPTATAGQTYVFTITAINDIGESAAVTVTHIMPAPPAISTGGSSGSSPTPTVTPTPTITPTPTVTPTPTPTVKPTVKPSSKPIKPKPTPSATAAGPSSTGDNGDDTDGDSISNNEDADLDGDGIVNGEDPDIDGDGIDNFEDGDPTDTTGANQGTPPTKPEVTNAFDAWWVRLMVALAATLLMVLAIARLRRRNRN